MSKSGSATQTQPKIEASEKVETLENSTCPMFPLETRKINNREFDFLIIDKPEKWDSCESFSSSYRLHLIGSHRAIEFPIRGVSYSEWEVIESQFPIPTYEEDDSPSRNPGTPNTKNQEEYEKKKEIVENKRMISVFEVSTNKKIPGSSIEEKLQWIENLGSGESEALFNRILQHFSNANSGSLIENYNSAFKSGYNGVEVIKLESFDDWMNVSNTGYIFRMQRPFENYICEIPLKKISESKKKEIQEATKAPMPPSKPGKNPVTGQIDASYVKYSWNDPSYLQASKMLARKKIVMLLEAVLPFDIPGVGFAEKYEWIGKRLIGDVVQLRDFVEDEIMNYRSRFNFFTEA